MARRRGSSALGYGIIGIFALGALGSVFGGGEEPVPAASRSPVATVRPLVPQATATAPATAQVTVVPATAAPATPRPTEKATPKPTKRPATPKPTTSVYYENCAAVRAAGKDPLYRGDPGYRSGLDRDNDGIACE